MQPICIPDTPVGEIATNVADWGGVHLKDVIALRDVVALSAAAVDYYMWRRLPAGNSSILCNVPNAALGKIVDINLSLVEAICFGRPGAVAREYFGRTCGTEDFIVPTKGLNTRLISPEPGVTDSRPHGQALPFHQDASVFPAQWTFLNAWTLLYPDRVPDYGTGLELIPCKLEELLEKQPNVTDPFRASIETSHARIADLIARYGSWVPNAVLGDVILFHQFTPHRSYFVNPTKLRISVEVRMIAKEQKVLDEYARNRIPYFSFQDGKIIGPKQARIDHPIEIIV